MLVLQIRLTALDYSVDIEIFIKPCTYLRLTATEPDFFVTHDTLSEKRINMKSVIDLLSPFQTNSLLTSTHTLIQTRTITRTHLRNESHHDALR